MAITTSFLGGIVAADVERRIGFGVAEFLSLLQGDREAHAFPHAGQDVVAGSVQDTMHAGDGITGECLAQRADDRNAAADRGFERQIDAALDGPFRPAPDRAWRSRACWP